MHYMPLNLKNGILEEHPLKRKIITLILLISLVTTLSVNITDVQASSNYSSNTALEPNFSWPFKIKHHKYKRVAPKPKGKWHFRFKKSYKVTLKKDGKKLGVAYIAYKVSKFIPKKYKFMFSILISVLSSKFIKGNNYVVAKSYSRKNKYVTQYRNTIKVYKDKKHHHQIAHVTRTQSFVKKYKLVKVK